MFGSCLQFSILMPYQAGQGFSSRRLAACNNEIWTVTPEKGDKEFDACKWPRHVITTRPSWPLILEVCKYVHITQNHLHALDTTGLLVITFQTVLSYVVCVVGIAYLISSTCFFSFFHAVPKEQRNRRSHVMQLSAGQKNMMVHGSLSMISWELFAAGKSSIITS